MKCLIDLDGVVAFFVKSCCQLFDKDPSLWPVGQYAFPFKMLGEASEDAVWDVIADCREDFWRNMPIMDDAVEIVKLCETHFKAQNCAFLTSPPKSSPWAAPGKIQWIKKHFPDYNRRILVGACKEFCAHQNAVLVDDYSVNTERFKEHGGHGILVPRPWNEEHSLDTIATLKIRLRQVTDWEIAWKR